MKKKVLLFAAATMITAGASAQLSVGLKTGYTMPTKSTVIGTETNGTTTTNIYGSFTKGIPVSLEFAYMLSDNIGIQMDATYLMGSEIMTNSISSTSFDMKAYSKSSQIRLAPQLRFELDNIYSRMGLMIPVGGKTTFRQEQTTTIPLLGTSETIIEGESKGSLSIGYVGAIGYQMDFGDNLQLFGEFEVVSLSIKSKSQEITRYDVDGIDQTSGMTTSQLQTEYVDELDSSASTSPSEPSKALAGIAPFSSYGFQVGVRIKL